MEDRCKLLLVLAKDYDLNRNQVRELMNQYLGLQLPTGGFSSNSVDYQIRRLLCIIHVNVIHRVVFNFFVDETATEDEGMLSTFYRMERNLRHALRPKYDVLLERLNTHPGGLKFLSVLRADLLSIIEYEYLFSYTLDKFCCICLLICHL